MRIGLLCLRVTGPVPAAPSRFYWGSSAEAPPPPRDLYESSGPSCSSTPRLSGFRCTRSASLARGACPLESTLLVNAEYEQTPVSKPVPSTAYSWLFGLKRAVALRKRTAHCTRAVRVSRTR
ncbi:hypothetical protein F5X98DRAFT_246483 [Xylaria grammica]|nr:hypothetical protein F5X98DRAFT_246483 [Xylaria grammica]